MNSTPAIRLGWVLLVAPCLACLGTARAQESWGGAGGASTWGGKSSTAATSSSAHAASAGGSSSWTAGRSSLGPAAATRGIWTDASGMPVAAGRGTAALAGKSTAPADLTTTPGISHLTSAASGGTHSASASSHPHVSGVQHGAKGRVGGLPKSGGKAVASSSRGGSHGHIDFKGPAANTTGAKKPSSSSAGKPSNPYANPGDMGEPTGMPDINSLPKY